MHAPATQIQLAQSQPERDAQMATLFPAAAGPALTDQWRGGRTMALQRLAAVDAAAYARSRNHLQGAVTRLSPYLRHGCLSLTEAIADVHGRFGHAAGKLVSELAYKDYFRQVWYRFGNDILQQMETAKVTLGQQALPAFVQQGFTGLVCMDEIVRQLQQQGYVHNHARMWLAAYLLHWLKIDWKAAADWFEVQLLDGDMASNHLSWQWVASSFSHKPYYFNRDNLQQFGGQAWCDRCQVRCPFHNDYASLQQQLFGTDDAQQTTETLASARKHRQPATVAMAALQPQAHDVVWVHDEMLSAAHPLLALDLPAVFVFDPQCYGHWPRKRLQFMADCLAEMPGVQVWLGHTAEVMQMLGATRVLTQQTPQMVLQSAVQPLATVWLAEPELYPLALSDHDLMRFSRYWKKVEPYLMGGF